MTATKASGHRVRRIFIECTATARRDVNTGIQRVVRNLVNHAVQIGPELGVTCRGMVFRSAAGFVPIDDLPPASGDGSPVAKTAGAFREKARAKFKDWLLAAGFLDSARRVKQCLHLASHRAVFQYRRLSKQGIDFGPGDVLLLPDESWHPEYPWDEVQWAQAQGAQVGLVLHDLIPIQYPEVVGQRTHDVFQQWWTRIRGIPDLIIGVSNSVLGDIDAVDRQYPPSNTQPTTTRRGFFHNGAGLDGTRAGGTVRDEFTKVFESAGSPATYLMVGMISPRKRIGLVLDAFDRLWAGGAELRLAIAGKYGWDCADLVERIRRHAQLGKKLFWFEDASDTELDHCYRHAAGLITASYAEGFNLPIVEALSKGCPVLASDQRVHREVGGAYAAFFPAGDAAALADLISRQQRTGSLPGAKPLADFHWPDWSESCRDLLLQAITLGSAAPAQPATTAHLRPAA